MVGRRKLSDPSLNHIFNALSIGVQFTLSFQLTNFGLKCLPTLYWNGTVMSKVIGKLRIKESSKNLFTSQTLLNWAIHTSLIQKRSSHSYQNTICVLTVFFVTQDYYSWVSVTVDLILQH